MKYLNSFLSILAILFSISFTEIKAQNPNRLEIPVKSSDASIFNIPLGEKGLIILTQTSKTDFHLAKLDVNFHQNWTFSVTLMLI